MLFTHTLIDLSSPRDNEEFSTTVCLFTTVINIPLLQNTSLVLRYEKEKACVMKRFGNLLWRCLFKRIYGNLNNPSLRSSLSSWSVGSQEAAVQDVDYISFLFSTMTGFSSDKLTSLQEAGDDYVLSPSSLTPLGLYCTPLDQFTHHWDIVEVRLPLAYNYFKPQRPSYSCCLQSEMLTRNLDEPETKRLKTDIVL